MGPFSKPLISRNKVKRLVILIFARRVAGVYPISHGLSMVNSNYCELFLRKDLKIDNNCNEGLVGTHKLHTASNVEPQMKGIGATTNNSTTTRLGSHSK